MELLPFVRILRYSSSTGIVSSEGGCADSQNSRLRVLNLELHVNRFDLRIEIDRVFAELAPDARLLVAAER